MIESAAEVTDIYLHPGELQLVSGPAILRTVLGSCVGITFRHERLGLAGMCHPMLPSYRKIHARNQTPEANTRYVDFAIEEMGRRLDALGAIRSEVETKLFGGGDVLPVNRDNDRPTIGRLNCEAAVQVLEDEGFRVVASSLRGECGVNIQFDSRSGEVLLRRLG